MLVVVSQSTVVVLQTPFQPRFQQQFVFFVLYMLCRPFNVYISSFYCFVKGVILISSPLLSILLSIQGIDLMMKQLIHFIINNSVWEYLLDTNHRETREKKKENTNIARDPFPMIVLRSKEKDIMNYELNY